LAAGEALEAFALAFYLAKAVVLAAPAHCAGFIADFQRCAVEIGAEPENIALCAAVKFGPGIAGMNFLDSGSTSNYTIKFQSRENWLRLVPVLMLLTSLATSALSLFLSIIYLFLMFE